MMNNKDGGLVVSWSNDYKSYLLEKGSPWDRLFVGV
jgi:hypothetical protein